MNLISTILIFLLPVIAFCQQRSFYSISKTKEYPFPVKMKSTVIDTGISETKQFPNNIFIDFSEIHPFPSKNSRIRIEAIDFSPIRKFPKFSLNNHGTKKYQFYGHAKK